MTIRLEGHEAIVVAERYGLTLRKYDHPIESARTSLTVNEARRVAREEDAWLVYLDVDDILLAVVSDWARRR